MLFLIFTVLKQINLDVYMWDVAYQLYVFSLTNSIIVKNSKKQFCNLSVVFTYIVANYM